MSLCCRETSERKNRQFFVSTTTISTTLSTQSLCFAQSNTLSMMLLCTFTRKKRTLGWEVFDKKNLGIDASPSLKEGKLSIAQEELDLVEKEVRSLGSPRYWVYIPYLSLSLITTTFTPIIKVPIPTSLKSLRLRLNEEFIRLLDLAEKEVRNF